MARLNVNPTRMELTSLKHKLMTSRRGHKLLKDKRDELMRIFLDKIRENRSLRLEVEEAIKSANMQMAAAALSASKEVTDVALMLPKQELGLEVSEKNVMSVKIPVFHTEYKIADPGSIYSYGYADTPGDMDGAILTFAEILPKLVKLAEVEKSCQLLASEIEKTRRRVNALEYVMIPNYEETIKYISMKLDENERSTTARLMKVKDMMISEGFEEKHRDNL